MHAWLHIPCVITTIDIEVFHVNWSHGNDILTIYSGPDMHYSIILPYDDNYNILQQYRVGMKASKTIVFCT